MSFFAVLISLSFTFHWSGASDESNEFEEFDFLMSTTHIDCDEKRSGDWDIDYVGKSTQFKLFDPCHENEFIKVKMAGLTEYDQNGKKTKNKVPTFASTNWNWNNANGVNTKYKGYSVVQNTFEAKNILRESDFTLSTILFKEDAVINNQTNINSYSIKWNVQITSWPFLDAANSLQLCINTMTNKENEYVNEKNEDNSHYQIGDFDLYVFDTAECDGSNENIKVNVTGNKNNNICFEFGYCKSGNIFYDPIISYVGDANDANGSNNVNDFSAAVTKAIIIIVCIISVFTVFWCFIGYQCYKKKKIIKEDNYLRVVDQVQV